MINLPIDQIRSDISTTLKQESRLILIATPGSGKSTRVPRFVWEDLQPKGHIIVLQPRRAAAIMLAKRVCDETETSLKEVIGYQVKGDSQFNSTTKIIYMTPGIFLRKCLSPEFLKNLSYLFLDEIHERTIEMDLCLALALKWQSIQHPLKCVAMSATLDEKHLKETFPAPILKCHHKPYELNIVQQSMTVTEAVKMFLKSYPEPTAHLLIFEAGKYEIQQVIHELEAAHLGKEIEITSLHGDMPLVDQQKVLQEKKSRKIIVSTNIAETSLTIPGVRGVIDTGQCKLLRKDIASGANQLKKEWISKDRADQRAGRAARTNTGIAIRLWSRQQQNGLRLSTDPEVTRCDLSSLIMWLACHQLSIQEAQLLTKPAEGALEKCKNDLTYLGVLNERFELTSLGQQTLKLPLQPKFSVPLLFCDDADLKSMTKAITYLEGQIKLKLNTTQSHSFDQLTDQLRHPKHAPFNQEVKRIQQILSKIRNESDTPSTSIKNWQHHLITAIPENLCFALPNQKKKYRIQGGGTGQLDTHEEKGLPSILWAAQISFKSKSLQNASLQWVIPIDESTFTELFKDQLYTSQHFKWDDKNHSMVKIEETCCFDDIILKSHSKTVPYHTDYIDDISNMILQQEIKLDSWNEKAQPWLQRYHNFQHYFHESEHLNFDQDDLLILIQEALESIKNWKDLFKIDWPTLFSSALSWDEQQNFEKNFPEYYTLKKGRRVKIQYFEDQNPKISSKLQDFYDQTPHPSICSNKLKLSCELLAPNQRPVQTTQDIVGFWDSSYPQVKKDLFRRYPKHEWR